MCWYTEYATGKRVGFRSMRNSRDRTSLRGRCRLCGMFRRLRTGNERRHGPMMAIRCMRRSRAGRTQDSVEGGSRELGSIREVRRLGYGRQGFPGVAFGGARAPRRSRCCRKLGVDERSGPGRASRVRACKCESERQIITDVRFPKENSSERFGSPLHALRSIDRFPSWQRTKCPMRFSGVQVTRHRSDACVRSTTGFLAQ